MENLEETNQTVNKNQLGKLLGGCSPSDLQEGKW